MVRAYSYIPDLNKLPFFCFLHRVDDSPFFGFCFYLPCHTTGVACPAGTGGQNTPPLPCAAGHYCPPGTGRANQYPCAAGSFSNRTNLESQENCTACPKGSFCIGGQVSPTDVCPRGHYCPDGQYCMLWSTCTCTPIIYFHAGMHTEDLFWAYDDNCVLPLSTTSHMACA